MPHPLIPAMILIALAPAASTDAARVARVEVAQLSFRQRIIIRIPRLPIGHARERDDSPPRPVRWAEKKGPKCVPLEQLAGAVITGPESLDLMVQDGARLRARLEDDCPSLDFYSGFYLKRNVDGMVCADRDSIRSRSGGACAIKGFKRLVAKR